MKKTSALILASTLLASPLVLADTAGSNPKCTQGKVNIEIYNKNLLSADCYSPGGEGKYCLYDLDLDTFYDDCVDESVNLVENTNESFSLDRADRKISIMHYLGTKGGDPLAKLYFVYDNGSFTNNCADVFGSDVQCIVTKSGSSSHLFYKVTMQKIN